MVELFLDSTEIIKNICMIKFKIVEDNGAWAVMNKLAALIEKCAVIFIRFDHEKIASTQSCRYWKTLRYTANQEAGLHAGMLQDPGQHGRGGRFTVRPRHGQYPTPRQHVIT